MKKYVPYEKLSKKAKREQDRKMRGSWHGINPITRRSEDYRIYNRQKEKEDIEKLIEENN